MVTKENVEKVNEVETAKEDVNNREICESYEDEKEDISIVC